MSGYFAKPIVSEIGSVNLSDKENPILVYFQAYGTAGQSEQYNLVRYTISKVDGTITGITSKEVQTYKNVIKINKDDVSFEDGQKYCIQVSVGRDDKFGDESQPVYFTTYNVPNILIDGLSSSSETLVKNNALTVALSLDETKPAKDKAVRSFYYRLHDKNGLLVYETNEKYGALASSEHTFTSLESGETYSLYGVVTFQNQITTQTPKYKLRVEFARPTTNAKISFMPDDMSGDVKVTAKLTSIKSQYDRTYEYTSLGEDNYGINLLHAKELEDFDALVDMIASDIKKIDKPNSVLSKALSESKSADKYRDVAEKIAKRFVLMWYVSDIPETFGALTAYGLDDPLDFEIVKSLVLLANTHPAFQKRDNLVAMLSEAKTGLFYEIPDIGNNDFSLEMWISKIDPATLHNRILYIDTENGVYEFFVDTDSQRAIKCFKYWVPKSLEKKKILYDCKNITMFKSNEVGESLKGESAYLAIAIKNNRVSMKLRLIKEGRVIE